MASARKRSEKSGLPPGSLVYVGEERHEPVRVEVITYDLRACTQRIVSPEELDLTPREEEGILWVNLDGVHDASLLERIGAVFGLHELTLEDILNTEQRPKLEIYDRYVFIVMKMLWYDGGERRLVHEQVSFILGEKFLLSFQEGVAGDVFESVRQRLRNERARIRSEGTDFLCYTLIDAIVDHYFAVLERIGEHISEIEDELIREADHQTLQTIHQLKRELVLLRKSVWPLREIVGAMERREIPFVTPSSQPFLRDVYDHIIQVMETLETYRDMLSGMVDIYMSTVSNRMNEIMKVLTIIATVFIPLTFIAGVYGMNFEHMPELHWRWGYAFAWGIMATVALGMFIYFRKKKWM
ncbi:MAG: magnesium/cobalt transporter CorA [Bacteroidota bacterium]|nr:magnesium/cobalt transporter CorA [Bacteroidota bacterium]